MAFCSYVVEDEIFMLSLTGSDGGHNYLTEQSLAELKETLATIRRTATPWSRGLVTTNGHGCSFCDGIDYSSAPVVEKLVRGMAEVLRELFNMPFPTVAAVGGDVKTSLALALVLAHDDTTVLRKAKIEAKEVRDGHDAVPPYLGSLLRDKASYPQMSSDLVLRSATMDGPKLKYWYLTEALCGNWRELESTAIRIITDDDGIGDIRNGDAYISTRKSLIFSESWKAVSEFLEDKH